MGWHIPKASDWSALKNAIGVPFSALGANLKSNITGFEDWDRSSYNTGNKAGFSALPAGTRDFEGDFERRGQITAFWEASESSTDSLYYANSRSLGNADLGLNEYESPKVRAFSVRCVMD